MDISFGGSESEILAYKDVDRECVPELVVNALDIANRDDTMTVKIVVFIVLNFVSKISEFAMMVATSNF